MNNEKIEQVVLSSGLWDSGRKTTHGFILSPSVYEVGEQRRKEFEAIGIALYDCLGGIGRIIHIAGNPELTRNKIWRMLTRVSHTGIPAIYHDIQCLKPSRTPVICKVDFMEDAVGHLWIAEIDGHNKHGLGYSTLAARIRKIITKAPAFPGVAAGLAEAVKKRSSDNNELTLLYADQERFYLPEFRILQDELGKHKISMTVIAEKDCDLLAEHNQYKLLLDFPFLYQNSLLNQRIAGLYRDEKVDFLIPPKPFFSSKAILALLRNDEQDKELEAILRSQISFHSLDLLRCYIPETYLVNKRIESSYWEGLCNGRNFVIKEAISSGMKGTVFPGDADFDTVFQKACSSYYHFILQQEISNRWQNFNYFSDEGKLLQDNWHMRITVHYTIRQVADIIVTARRDKKVHGALDCLQVGAVIV